MKRCMRIMNIAMMRNSSMLEFRPPLFFGALERAGAACLTYALLPLVLWMLSFMIFLLCPCSLA